MKKIIVGMLLAFSQYAALAQIGYESNIVIDDSFGVSRPTDTQIADIDNDGFKDIVVAGSPKIAWFKSINGTGSYTKGKIANNDFGSYSNVVCGDLDNDGDVDIAFSFWGNNVQSFYWCKNTDGQGNFGTPTLLINGGSFMTNKMQLVDIDLDNDLDIVVSTMTYLSVFENTNGAGTFTERLIVGSHTSSSTSVANFAMQNIDSEPKPELVTVVNGNLICYKINANFTLSVVDSITSSAYSDSYEIADINNDGFPDIVTSYNNGNTKKLQWFKNLTGAGLFGTAQNLVTMPSTQSTNSNGNDEKRVVAIADLDNDNKVDIVHIDSNIANANWYKNMGNGTFSMQQLLTTSNYNIRDVKIFDADNDGSQDILMTVRGENKVVWYKNTNGAGNFSAANLVTHICYSPNNVDYGDIDHDGDYDLLTSSAGDGKLAWYENTDGLGHFDEPQQVIVENFAGAANAQLGDLDNDGDLDALVTSWYQYNGDHSSIAWYQNSDGHGTFTTQQLVVSNTEQLSKVRLVDIDNDQDLDIISASYNNLLSLYKNNGNGTFAPAVVFSTYSINMSILDMVVTDLDNDNDPDLVVSFNDDEIAWYENTDGLGMMTKHVIVPTMSYPMSLAVADLDGDLLKEVIFCNRFESKIGYFKNLGSGTFANATLINVPGLFHPASCLAQDIDNDGDNDLIFDNMTGAKLFYLLNDGAAGFSAPVDIYASSFSDSYNQNVRGLKSVDMNADGKLDVVFSEVNRNKICWLQNLGLLQNNIAGTIKIDANNNGCDNLDHAVPNALVTAQNGGASFATFSGTDGTYQLFAGQGTYNTSVASPETNYSANPASYNLVFASNNNIATADFCLQPIQLFDDLKVTVYPLTSARAGFVSRYKILIKNVGTNVASGTVNFTYNYGKFDYLSASETAAAQTQNSLSFVFAALSPFESKEIELTFQVKTIPSVTIGESVVFNCVLEGFANDIHSYDNEFALHQTVVSAYDPNDITVLEGSQVLIENADEFLHYLIRFQNTGNSYARRVNIRNTLDDKLDWSTMQLESASHSNRVEIKDGNQINFIFDAIYLPASSDDYNGSQGYISYKIKPKSNTDVGDIVHNTAQIYFDYNPAINTNTVQTEFVGLLSNPVYSTETDPAKVWPNPLKDWLHIDTDLPDYQIAIYDQIGQLVFQGTNQHKINLSHLNTGVYILKITDSHGQTLSKKILKF